MAKQLAIIKRVGFGMRDCHEPVLWFNSYVTESSAALQVLFWEEAKQLIMDSEVYDVKQLEGKAIWVETDGNLIKLIGYAKI